MLGTPAAAVLFFTRYDNLCLDFGVKRRYKETEYANRISKILPTKTGTAVVIEGPMETATRIEVKQAGVVGTKTASFPVETLNAVTHVAEVPVRLRRGTYQFALRTPSGRTLLAPKERSMPARLGTTNGFEKTVTITREHPAWRRLRRLPVRIARRLQRRRSRDPVIHSSRAGDNPREFAEAQRPDSLSA
jgi:hypothetical protein